MGERGGGGGGGRCDGVGEGGIEPCKLDFCMHYDLIHGVSEFRFLCVLCFQRQPFGLLVFKF